MVSSFQILFLFSQSIMFFRLYLDKKFKMSLCMGKGEKGHLNKMAVSACFFSQSDQDSHRFSVRVKVF